MDSAPAQSYLREFTGRQSRDDDGDEEDDEGFSFEEDSYRATFFRTSAERGRWESDPIPHQLPLAQMRKSVPTLSPVLKTISHVRPISEPAPSTSSVLPCSVVPKTPNSSDDDFDAHNLDDIDDIHIMPSLAIDRDSSSEVDDPKTPSSPLPPSSPPLSPMSLGVSSMSRSVSPFSFAPSSPISAPSQPLLFNEISSTAEQSSSQEDRSDPKWIDVGDLSESLGGVELVGMKMQCEPSYIPEANVTTRTSTPRTATLQNENPVVITQLDTSVPTGGTRTLHVNEEVRVSDGLASSPDGDTCHPDLSHSGVMDLDLHTFAVQSEVDPLKSLPSNNTTLVEGENATTAMELNVHDNDVLENSNVSFCSNLVDGSQGEEDDNALKIKEHNGDIRKDDGINTPMLNSKATPLVLGKHKKDPTKWQEVSVKKKRRTSETTTLAHSTTQGVPKTTKKTGKRRLEEENVSDSSEMLAPKSKKQKRSESRTESHSRNHGLAVQVASSSKIITSKSPQSRKTQKPSEQLSEPVDPETAALDAEMCGMLIESMALSRASSLPLSFLCKAVMQARPSLKTEKTEKEWLQVFDRVLHNGEASRGSGVFGKVESSGKDDSDRPLEAQWFYVPELDEDQERATLIRSMMPRPAKRSETKKYKQYYWRPLEKISRWDPEDDL